MRNRAEILFDAVRKTDKDVTVPQFSDKLRLLTLEVLVDLRDEINETNNILASVKRIIYRQV